MKINIKIGDKILTATLADNATARDFLSVLPLNVKMEDLFGREKYGDLPKPLSEDTPRQNRTRSAMSLIGLRTTNSLCITTRTESRYLRRASLRSQRWTLARRHSTCQAQSRWPLNQTNKTPALRGWEQKQPWAHPLTHI